MPQFIDFTNKKIGRVLVKKYLGIKNTASNWLCICDCLQEFESESRNFKRGHLFECKKCRIARRTVDLTGKIFSRWTVLSRGIPDKRGKTMWNCKCECGIERVVSDSGLKKHRASMSCGCLGRKLKSKWVNPSLYPKQSFLSTSEVPFYSMRTQLIHKCYNPKWETYSKFGAIGYTVCDLWRNDARAMYEWALKNGWQASKCIYLEKGKKEFNPETARIISESEMRSIIGKRGGIYVKIGKRTKNLKDWAKEKNISRSSITNRVKSGMDHLDAINLEVKTHKLRSLNDIEKQEIINKYNKGNSLSVIGKKFNVSGGSIRYLLEKEGIPIRDVHDRSGVTNEQIKKDLENGLNPSEISRKYNVTSTCIYTRIKHINGIKRKR